MGWVPEVAQKPFLPSFKFLLKSSFSWPLTAGSKAERLGSSASPAGERDSCDTHSITQHPLPRRGTSPGLQAGDAGPVGCSEPALPS